MDFGILVVSYIQISMKSFFNWLLKLEGGWVKFGRIMERGKLNPYDSEKLALSTTLADPGFF